VDEDTYPHQGALEQERQAAYSITMESIYAYPTRASLNTRATLRKKAK
jgi:hypothetical protein